MKHAKIRKTEEYKKAVDYLKKNPQWPAADFFFSFGHYRLFRNWKLKRL